MLEVLRRLIAEVVGTSVVAGDCVVVGGGVDGSGIHTDLCKTRVVLSQENRAMPLKILVRIEVYNGIARFLCHSTHFLLVFACRLQCQKVTSTRKNQSD